MRDLHRRWTFRETVEAHEMLDALEDADMRAQREAQKRAEAAYSRQARGGR